MYLDRGPKFPARLQRKQIRTYVREKRDKEESKYRYGSTKVLTYLSIYFSFYIDSRGSRRVGVT
jgi:hypothetical protein